MHGYDSRMAQLSRCAGFAQKALKVRFCCNTSGMWNLKSYHPIQCGIAGLPNRSKRSRSNPLQQLEFAEWPHRHIANCVANISNSEIASASRAKNLVGIFVGDL